MSHAINEFIEIKNIYKNIPECQTNFVYSKQRPKSTKDILGISGRIVKAGKEVIVAGNLSYGGSKHVATALLTVNKKFPQIYSAINIKFQNTTITKIKKSKLKISNYDRNQEPSNVKNNGSTIEWGIKNAIKNLKEPPDVIFHKGDFGKEPMIILFGETPKSILKKLLKISG
ncbi:thiamine-phosphate synthase family protein [Candidatus Nitrosopumilus sediminis]|uniref:thiamine-phosphate synthase family protein n=1 Tax=Candidatus Nitrosopumilus sediminis TaxID=1229909 RepID=UPI003B838D32